MDRWRSLKKEKIRETTRASKNIAAQNTSTTTDSPGPEGMQNVRNHDKTHARDCNNPEPNIISISLNPLYHTTISFDSDKLTHDIPNTSPLPVPQPGISEVANYAQPPEAQSEPPDYGILAGTDNMDDDDEEDSDYMRKGDGDTESSDEDTSLNDEKDMEGVSVTSELVV